ncbi:hypothetical protein TTHERM_000058639 (macronuclear) [Tetrahymena thermophila SB210]|uniref:Uncharacterized protein n=1 Tax=Tetrahymena thermophila (strain SB210) TaxID=312017 RepID=W7XH65_TETTS|nr:hypothetical protein TTHERM_000058639 [Tetrahymena thermophila SB210]EWS76503.1 hypothetical protein TTHERM_000058639 [Tetrahymena thermophila SB210]|eukprot:XP_012650962.1 hypothetical protein TTHERM_000058639 [Tetrahymena thermophila SB210]
MKLILKTLIQISILKKIQVFIYKQQKHLPNFQIQYFQDNMFFFSKDNITSKGESEIEKEIERKKKQEQEQTKIFYEKLQQKMIQKEEFQKRFSEYMNQYSNEHKLYFNTLYEIKDYIASEEKNNAETLNSIKSLAIHTKYLIMNTSDYKKLIKYLENFPNLKVLWITISVATFGIDKLNCDESSLELLRLFILENFSNQLEALYVKFNFDSHDSQWNNRKKTIQQIITQWDDTFEKKIAIYRCDYQFQGLLI